MSNRAALEVRIHDASISIWQDDARDVSFRTDIYAALIRGMRARGWSIRRDPRIHRHHRCISPNHRLGARGSLCCGIEITGRVVKVEFWSITARQSNRNGRRYDFDKMRLMHHLDRLRVELEFKRMTAWLATLAPVKVSRSQERDLAPMQRIEQRYAESWHTDKTLGRPHWNCDGNRKSGDGAFMEHGQIVWFADNKGRIIRGTAYYNINNMWWVVAGGELHNEGCHSLYAKQPINLRTKQNERARRTRLEKELSIAVARMDFPRAEVLKRILFGIEQAFLIWARNHQAYYRAQYAGYTADRISAGKYTRAEAEAECRRVPHELAMVCPDGKHICFDRRSA